MKTKIRYLFVSFVLLAFTFISANAQKCATPGKDGSASISGIVNTYFPGSSSIVAGATSITLGAGQGASTAITTGDLLLIIQMQGADVQGTNSNVYGDNTASTPANGYLATNLSAGLYEYAVAAGNVAITGGSLTLQSGTTNAYTVRNNSGGATQGQARFQVIRVPQYSSVSLSADLTPLLWNGSVGGIIAIDVAGVLNFNGFNINVSASGFRGGGGRQLGGNTGGTGTDYMNVASLNFHGNKGEGFAGSPRFMNNNGTLLDNTQEGYPNGSTARGAPANAGGGSTDSNPVSNDQNAGGGGGGNGGAGGIGGNSWNSNAAVGGYGGSAFAEVATSRLVMGGGGGSGNTNDGTGTPGSGFASSGAAGGGMVMIRTGSVSGTGTINANGGNANNTVLNDGSGGGGAGGSVLLIAASSTGFSNITIYAQGGTGGTNTGAGASHGPGGGGGGGVIYTSATVNASSSVSGGANGTTATNPGPAAYGAASGSTGVFLQSATAPANSIAGYNCIAPPTANNILAPTENNSYGQTVIPSLSASDPYGKIASYTIVSLPTGAQGVLYLCNSTCNTVSVGQTVATTDIEKLKFDPAASFTGNAGFTYSATNASGVVSNTASYTIPVKNEPPLADNILSGSLTNTSGSQTIPTLAAADPDGSIASYNITSIPVAATQGTVTYCSNGTTPCTGVRTNITGAITLTTAQAGTLAFTPVATFTGTTSFNYTATDNSGLVSPAATYTIAVRGASGVHVPPYSDNIAAQQINNTASSVLLPNFASHATTGTISSYKVESIPSASQGSLTYCSNGTEPCTGTVTAVTAGLVLSAANMATLKFTPLNSFAGTASFTYSATDNAGAKSNIANYSIPVVDMAPVANPITTYPMTNTFAQTAIPALSGHDASTITGYTIATLPSVASGVLYLCNPTCNTVSAGQNIALADIAKLKFDPAGTFTGTASFTYTATDAAGSVSQPATYSIPVTASVYPSNVSPIATNVSSSTIANTSSQTAIPSLASTDADGTISSYTINNIPGATQGVLYLCNPTCNAVTAGQVIATADAGSLKFAPTAGYKGTVVFDYSAKDNSGATSNIATYSIPVSGAAPQTNNVTSTALATTSGQSAISSLSGGETGGSIVSYTINNLPPAAAGTLYLCTPVCTLVSAGQVITAANAGSLKFTPSLTYTGLFTQFNYTSTDAAGLLGNEASFTIPITVNNTTLPLQLISFAGEKKTGGVQLDWKTENEINVSGYTLQRSADGSQFANIATVTANNSTGTNNYGWLDGLIGYTGNIVYYRLKLTDNDGKFTYSNIIVVKLDSKGNNSLVVSPNPVVDKVRMIIHSEQNNNAVIQIVSALGQQVYQTNTRLLKGDNQVIFYNWFLQQHKGVYFVKATIGNQSLTTRFVFE
ncbi:MAG: T9SS type A sorting domain-containing protein [Chitinophagaceae bacterium]